MASACVVFTTFGKRADAERIGRTLVEERLAACVNVLGEVRSIYRWKGAVEDAREVLCLVKTTRQRFQRLKARLVELHPYELPEVIALSINDAHAPYLRWVTAEVAAAGRTRARPARRRRAASR